MSSEVGKLKIRQRQPRWKLYIKSAPIHRKRRNDKGGAFRRLCGPGSGALLAYCDAEKKEKARGEPKGLAAGPVATTR